MAFSKTFPKQVGAVTQWEEVVLTLEEETQAEEECRRENTQLLNECLEDAKFLAIQHGINTDENRAQLAIALFEKRASHAVFWKEKNAKEKFDHQKL